MKVTALVHSSVNGCTMFSGLEELFPAKDATAILTSGITISGLKGAWYEGSEDKMLFIADTMHMTIEYLAELCDHFKKVVVITPYPQQVEKTNFGIIGYPKGQELQWSNMLRAISELYGVEELTVQAGSRLVHSMLRGGHIDVLQMHFHPCIHRADGAIPDVTNMSLEWLSTYVRIGGEVITEYKVGVKGCKYV